MLCSTSVPSPAFLFRYRFAYFFYLLVMLPVKIYFGSHKNICCHLTEIDLLLVKDIRMDKYFIQEKINGFFIRHLGGVYSIFHQ